MCNSWESTLLSVFIVNILEEMDHVMICLNCVSFLDKTELWLAQYSGTYVD